MEILIIAVAVFAILKLTQWAKNSKDEITCPFVAVVNANQCLAAVA